MKLYMTLLKRTLKPLWTKVVRNCLIHPFARMSECLVSYLCLDYECKVGHSDLIPVKCELNISCNLLSIHTNFQVGISKAYGQKYESGQGTQQWVSVPNLKNFEEFILIHDVMNAEQCHSYVRLVGDKIIKSPRATKVKSVMVTRDGYRLLIRTGDGHWF